MALSKIQTTNNQVVPNLGRRNLIINGSMQIAQRGTSATTTGYATVDRFAVNQTNFDQLVSTKTQDSSVPVGFAKSFKITTTTQETALATDEYGNMCYKIEGQDLQHLAYGTSSAESFTLSFYVKSNLTGNFSVTVTSGTQNKQQDRRYTINSADTWERKTLTFLGDTAQSIVNDTTVGMYLFWHTAFGATYGTDTYNPSVGWSAYSNAGWGAGQDVNTLYNAQNNYLQFTGVQMEVGNTATDFEHRSVGEELRGCQRYYTKFKASSAYSYYGSGLSSAATTARIWKTFPVEMNHIPVLEQSANNTWNIYNTDGGSGAFTADATINHASTWGSCITCTTAANLNANGGCCATANNTTTAYFAFESEI